jgi:hypothetical protein
MAAARADLQKLENDCFYQPVHARNVGLVRKLLDVALPVWVSAHPGAHLRSPRP